MTTRQFQRPVVIFVAHDILKERARRQSPHGQSRPLAPKSRNTTCVTAVTRNRDNVAAHAATFSLSSLVFIRQTDIFLSVALTRNFTFLT